MVHRVPQGRSYLLQSKAKLLEHNMANVTLILQKWNFFKGHEVNNFPQRKTSAKKFNETVLICNPSKLQATIHTVLH